MAARPHVVVILGQDCDPAAYWVEQFEANWISLTGGNVSFFYPPLVAGVRAWHSYTPGRSEDWARTHRASRYHVELAETAPQVFKLLDVLESGKLPFSVCAYSNGGAIAFEAGIAYAFCKSVLWVASVPVLSQQHRSAELKCPVGFLHGTRDRYYFGGHDAVKIVAEKCAGHWSEYDGGHSDCSESLAYTELMHLS